jgi:hypothetical protein
MFGINPFKKKKPMVDTIDETTNPEELAPLEGASEEAIDENHGPKTGTKCENCDGTGLADLKTKGNAATELCVPCEGSGTIK